MDKLKEAVILAGQVVGRTKQDHIVFKCNRGYDFCNPKIHKEPVVRYLKYAPKLITVSDEKGKEVEKISLEKVVAEVIPEVKKVDTKKHKPSSGKAS